MRSLFEQILDVFTARGFKLTTAESCTGGLIGAALTNQSGISAIYEGGFITYSNALKQRLLGVSAATLEAYGAVSPQTAEEMAAGALIQAQADVAVSVTGVAGPTGGTAEKPVGLVYIGIATKHGSKSVRCMFDGNRDEIRSQTVTRALELVLEAVI